MAHIKEKCQNTFLSNDSPKYLLKLLWDSIKIQMIITMSLFSLTSLMSFTPSALPPPPYLSFLVGVRQIKVSAGFTYHTVASTTLQAIEWEPTTKPFNTMLKVCEAKRLLVDKIRFTFLLNHFISSKLWFFTKLLTS